MIGSLRLMVSRDRAVLRRLRDHVEFVVFRIQQRGPAHAAHLDIRLPARTQTDQPLDLCLEGAGDQVRVHPVLRRLAFGDLGEAPARLGPAGVLQPDGGELLPRARIQLLAERLRPEPAELGGVRAVEGQCKQPVRHDSLFLSWKAQAGAVQVPVGYLLTLDPPSAGESNRASSAASCLAKPDKELDPPAGEGSKLAT